MPTSNYQDMEKVIEKVIKKRPKRVLDVGIGFGRWGFITREFLDIAYKRYNKEDWKHTIDGVEIFPFYITPASEYVYDTIFQEDYREVYHKRSGYDLVIMSDVLEHIEKDLALEIIGRIRKLNKSVIIVVPTKVLEQGAVFGNENERHISQFSKSDFERHGYTVIIGDSKTIAFSGIED